MTTAPEMWKWRSASNEDYIGYTKEWDSFNPYALNVANFGVGFGMYFMMSTSTHQSGSPSLLFSFCSSSGRPRMHSFPTSTTQPAKPLGADAGSEASATPTSSRSMVPAVFSSPSSSTSCGLPRSSHPEMKRWTQCELPEMMMSRASELASIEAFSFKLTDALQSVL